MLLEFSITNFRSIKGVQTLSLLPAEKLRKRQSILLKAARYPKLMALPSAVIFGPNNAGKSNFLKGFNALKLLVERSHTFNLGDSLEPNEAFEFDIETQKKPTTFFIDFIAADGLRYDYTIQFNRYEILLEDLGYYPINESGKMSRANLFKREKGESIDFGDYLKGNKRSVEHSLRDNQLFLSKAVQDKNEQLDIPYSFFKKYLRSYLFHGEEYDEMTAGTLARFFKEDNNREIVNLIELILSQIDIGIVGVEATPNEEIPRISFPENMPEEEKQKAIKAINDLFKFKLKTKHILYKNEKEVGIATLPLKEQSTGTIKFFNMLRLILPTLAEGKILIVDELDKSLHPDLTKLLIRLFHSPNTNPKNAQLIIATHDTSLLASDLFNRDQLFFIQKDRFGASEIFSIADFKNVSATDPFDRLYLSGRFNAVPNIKYFAVEQEIANSPIFHEQITK